MKESQDALCALCAAKKWWMIRRALNPKRRSISEVKNDMDPGFHKQEVKTEVKNEEYGVDDDESCNEDLT